MRAVLDASVAVKWFIRPEEGSDKATALLQAGPELFAPQFFRVELVNVLLKYVRRGILTQAEFQEMYIDFNSMQILEYIPDDDLERKAIEMSLALHHSLYDCLYLACAMDQGAPFISADMQFLKKVREMEPDLERFILPLSEV